MLIDLFNIRGEYEIKIELGSPKAYDEVSSFLTGASFGWTDTEKNRYYFPDIKNKEAIIKMDSKNNVAELTKAVEQSIINRINHIKKQESVR